MVSSTLSSRPAAAEIRWRSGAAATQAKAPDEIRAVITELAARENARHVVVQLDQPLLPEQRVALERARVKLLVYLGDNAFFATLSARGVDAGAVARMPALLDVRSIERIWKLHPAIAAGRFPDYAVVDRSDPQNLRVAAYLKFHQDVDLATTGVNTARKHGAVIMDRVRSINVLVIELPQAGIDALADEDVVQWIEPPLPRFSEVNDDNRILSQVDTLQASPFNLDGTGISVLVYDGGFGLASHQDFGGRLTVRDNSGLSDHSTHVAGTVGGDGSLSGGLRRGMAPAVTIESYGFQFDGTGIFLYSNPGDLESDYDQAINVFGADISNNSIGTNTEANGFPCSIQGDYGVTSELIDSIVTGSLGAPFRIIWANGNERGGSRCDVEGFGDYYSTAPPAGAKNHITVGAVNSNSEGMTSFSSWGPVDDGRMKPDISGPGCQGNDDNGVTSTSSGGGYSVKCGTSMAAPTVTGLCSLILEDFRAQFPAQPDPRNSTLKALLAHNAKDKGNPGPDYQFGYGMVKGQETIDFMRTGNFDEDQVSQGGLVTYQAIVTDSDAELKVTIAWDDEPGTPNVDPALVNDLDLVVLSPSAVQAFPWTLDPLDPSARATQDQANTLDNIEQVLVEAPESGTWTIEVHGTNVPQGPQSFSICVSPAILSTGVTISLPNGPPEVLSPGVATTVSVEIVAIGESLVGGSQTLRYRFDGGVFQTAPLTPLGGDLYEAGIPSAGCTDSPEFYFTATGTISGTVSLPANAPTDVFSAAVGTTTVVLDDDFETNLGWTAGAVGDTATTGIWTRVDPNGTEAQPEDDHTVSPGVTSFVTGQGTVGGSLGENDVDGGNTTLVSPILDLSAFGDATVSYYRWYSNSTGAAPNTDVFTVDISNNGGSTWTNVETVGPSGADVVGGWVFHEFNVTAFVALTNQVLLRFVADDAGSGSVVEAAVDDVLVTGFDCTAQDCTVDPDCDDGAFCNGAETCVGGFCQAGTPVNCNDGIACTDDSCNEGTDSCDNVANNANCDDGLFCNGSETCSATLDCQAGTAPNCDDGVGCTDDSCNEGTDSCDNIANSANCDDGVFCNGSETCSATLDCQAGTAPTCDDGVGCTDDSCNAGTDSCDNIANNANCPDDGLFCNGTEFCDAVSDCSSTGDPCTGGETCNEATDTCDPPACNNDGTCDAGEDCNNCPNDCFSGGGGFCGDGICAGSANGEDCFLCSADCRCAGPGCNACCGDGFCGNNGEKASNCPVDCDPGFVPPSDGSCCGDGTCDGTENVTNCAIDCGCTVPADCDDAVACTIDDCVAGACQNTPDNGACPDDGQFCNGTEFCDAVSDCGSTGDPCSAGETCNESTDTCDPCTPKNSNCTTGAECCSGICKNNGRCR